MKLYVLQLIIVKRYKYGNRTDLRLRAEFSLVGKKHITNFFCATCIAVSTLDQGTQKTYENKNSKKTILLLHQNT